MTYLKRTAAALAASALLALGLSVPAVAAPAPVSTAAVVTGNADAYKGSPVISKATGKIVGDLGSKSAPGAAAKSGCGVCRVYIGTHQFIGTGTGATSVKVTTSQHNPYLDPADFHSLWEVSAQGASTVAGNQNIVEIGWRRSSSCSSSTNPCLFAYNWVNGVGQGYAGITNTGWVDNPTEAVNAGTPLAITTAGAAPSTFYEYQVGRGNTVKCDGVAPVQTTATLGWLVYQQNVGSTRIIGCFPDSIWTSAGETFTDIDLAQSFNELAASDTNPCSDMGYGTYGSSTSPSASQDTNAYVGGGFPAGTVPEWTPSPGNAVVTPSSYDPTAYRAYQASTTRYRSGGPGYDSIGGTLAGTVGNC